MGYPNVHVIVPSNVNEPAIALQTAPKLLAQKSSDYVADTIRGQYSAFTKFESLLLRVLESLNREFGKSTLGEER